MRVELDGYRRRCNDAFADDRQRENDTGNAIRIGLGLLMIAAVGFLVCRAS